MAIRSVSWVLVLFAGYGCTSSSGGADPPVAHVGVGDAGGSPVPELVEVSGRSPSETRPRPPAACGAEQFVGCKTSEACSRKQGQLITPQTCLDHAADACREAACEHGCDIYNGTPNEVRCAMSASSASNMQRCGGYSGWGCPENTRCELPKNAFDAVGECVPTSH